MKEQAQRSSGRAAESKEARTERTGSRLESVRSDFQAPRSKFPDRIGISEKLQVPKVGMMGRMGIMACEDGGRREAAGTGRRDGDAAS
jgi:hypothetical protein